MESMVTERVLLGVIALAATALSYAAWMGREGLRSLGCEIKKLRETVIVLDHTMSQVVGKSYEAHLAITEKCNDTMRTVREIIAMRTNPARDAR